MKMYVNLRYYIFLEHRILSVYTKFYIIYDSTESGKVNKLTTLPRVMVYFLLSTDIFSGTRWEK